MKKVILGALLPLSMVSCVTTKVLPTPPPKTETVLLSTNKNTNYIKANEWMVSTFNNPQSVIQFTDKEGGIIKGKYSIIINPGQAATQYTAYIPSSTLTAIITLRVKDSGAKIEIEPTGGFYSYLYGETEYGITPEMFNMRCDILINDFKKNMLQESKNDNW